MKKGLKSSPGDFSLSIDTKPVPASRPRVSKWGTYYAKTYRRWRDQAAILLREARCGPEPLSGPLAVLTEIVSPKARTSKRHWPQGDNDNYEKAIWDVITNQNRFWGDDDQIVFNATWKRYAKANETPGVRLHVYQLEDNE